MCWSRRDWRKQVKQKEKRKKEKNKITKEIISPSTAKDKLLSFALYVVFFFLPGLFCAHVPSPKEPFEVIPACMCPRARCQNAGNKKKKGTHFAVHRWSSFRHQYKMPGRQTQSRPIWSSFQWKTPTEECMYYICSRKSPGLVKEKIMKRKVP